MIDLPADALVLGTITLLAAIVNGALGYGFSSITVPLALLFVASRVLNPALVLVEVAINLYVLAVNWRGAGAALRRVDTLLVGLVPGVLVGSVFLAAAQSEIVRLATYVVLIPLILIQAGGVRRPLPSVRAVGLPFGAGVGLLYSVTTISGPPLALLFNNQGYPKRDFRASLAVVRVAESSLTSIAYLTLGLFTPGSVALVTPIVPAVLLGIPAGTWLICRVDPETFRRICMSFDAWIVALGLSRVIEQLQLASAPGAYLVLLTVVLIDIALLYRFFVKRIGTPASPATVAVHADDVVGERRAV